MTNKNSSHQRWQKWPQLNAEEAIAYVSFANSFTLPTWAWWRSLQGFTQICMPALHSKQEDVPYSCLHHLLAVRCQRFSWPQAPPKWGTCSAPPLVSPWSSADKMPCRRKRIRILYSPPWTISHCLWFHQWLPTEDLPPMVYFSLSSCCSFIVYLVMSSKLFQYG